MVGVDHMHVHERTALIQAIPNISRRVRHSEVDKEEVGGEIHRLRH